MTEYSDTLVSTELVSNKKYIPVFTILCCLASVILFIGINCEVPMDSWEAHNRWGYVSGIAIFKGQYWGLITSNFLHVEIWHIAFNVYWFWFFGRKMEFESGRFFYILFVFSTSLVSSLAQLIITDSTGIGLSGIVYAQFGFILIKSRDSENYKNYLDSKTNNLFIAWLLLCIILTYTDVWVVGNAAHVGGLLWGMLLAYISKYERYKQWVVAFLFFYMLIASVIWSPTSVSWLSYQAYELHDKGKLDEAMVLYKKILSRDSDNEFAKLNLKQLEKKNLQEKAYKLHDNEQYNEARKVYMQLLSIDSTDQWAKDNLKALPDE